MSICRKDDIDILSKDRQKEKPAVGKGRQLVGQKLS
jgi:hypothetical protein